MNFASNSLSFWQFRVNWSNSTQTTLSGPINIPVAVFSEACNGAVCIPQSGTTEQLDSLADRLMYRLAYRNFGDHEALVVNHSVVAGSSVGVRWYEIRNPASPIVFQQGTYAPDSNYRWMGSMAMDHVGDIAVGYSVSSGSMHPAIRYTGRLPSDAQGTLQGETSIVEGTGSQTANLNRWGDYSSISVDPVDDCTFWYTNQYLKTNGTFNWSTRIASFKFPSCATAPPSAPTGLVATAGNAQVSLSWNSSAGATSYNVLRSMTNGGPYTTIAPHLATTSYTDTGLANGTTYYYVVQAVNGAGTSPNSAQASATPAAPAPTITGLSPNSGAVGTAVTITGANFGSAPGTVTFNTVATTPSIWSPTTIVAPVPAGATTGNVVVTVSGVPSNGVSFTVTSSSGGWPNGYALRRTITIDHTKVPNTDQSNFPVLISGTYPYLATIANGGNVSSPSGNDILFTSDSAGTSTLAFEQESYSASTGAMNYWVKVPTVSHTSDTVIYLFYGNSSVTTDQSNKTAVWDSNYKLVWHLPNGSSLSTNDSTSNGNNGLNTATTATTGEIDGGGLFNGGSSRISISNILSIDVTSGDFTVNIWFYANSYSSYNTLFDKGVRGVSGDYSFFINGATTGWWEVGKAGAAWNAPGFTTGVWHYLTMQRSGSITSAYLDGSFAFGTNSFTGTTDSGGELDISGNPTGGGSLWNGKLDEFRVSNTARSADWIATEYKNQSSPSTFYSVGAAQ